MADDDIDVKAKGKARTKRQQAMRDTASRTAGRYAEDPSAEGYRRQALVRNHGYDKKRVNDAAWMTKGGWPTDKEYMKAVGDEALKVQRGKMGDTGRDESEYAERKPAKRGVTIRATGDDKAKAKPSSFAKGGVVRKTGLAKVYKGERVLTKRQAAPTGKQSGRAAGKKKNTRKRVSTKRG